MKGCIYLITRMDGLQYVGITSNIKRRISAHSKTERFAIGIERIDVIMECEIYEDAEKLEAYFIEKYDTFHNGLNESIDGKGNHLAPSFTTRGYKFSEETRIKMKNSHWSKTGKYLPKGTIHTEDQKSKWSIARKGKAWGGRKIPREEALQIIEAYAQDSVIFDNEYITLFVKKLDRDKVGSVSLTELRAPNGKALNRLKLYSEFFAEKYGVTKQAIERILKYGVAQDADKIRNTDE